MRKPLAMILSICLTFCLSGCDFEEVSLLYSDSIEKDGFYIAVNETANCCFVGPYTCTEQIENQEITIPDEYENIPVTRIGGYYGRGVPVPFYILLADLNMNALQDSRYAAVFSGDLSSFNISEDYRVEELSFVLNIGKSIKTIEYVDMDNYYPHINKDGSITFYHPVVYVNCSEENEYFYSENGKLYDKTTNEIISEFEYAESNS